MILEQDNLNANVTKKYFYPNGHNANYKRTIQKFKCNENQIVNQ